MAADGAYEALVQTAREALREGGSGINSTYEEDAAMVLQAVLPHIANLLRNHPDARTLTWQYAATWIEWLSL